MTQVICPKAKECKGASHKCSCATSHLWDATCKGGVSCPTCVPVKPEVEDLFNILENEIVFDGRHILIDNLVEIQKKIDALYTERAGETRAVCEVAWCPHGRPNMCSPDCNVAEIKVVSQPVPPVEPERAGETCQCGHNKVVHIHSKQDEIYGCLKKDCKCLQFIPAENLFDIKKLPFTLKVVRPTHQKSQPASPEKPEPKFNNALEADALDWDTRNLEPDPPAVSKDLMLTDEKMYRMIKDYEWGKTKEERGFILGVMGVTSEAQLAKVQPLLTANEAKIRELEKELGR